MARTSAERQAAYRARRAGKDSAERRINTWIGAETYLALERLAGRYGVTKRVVIELLVSYEDGRLRAKGELLSVAAAVCTSPELPRNESQEVADKNSGPKKHRAQALLHNAVPEVANKKREKQSIQPQELRPTQSHGDQYGFEF